MNVMKSLLLGSAAGVVAMSGAQAADLPVKAKAVEYVKVCSAYGAGFYYIPGTDICLRVGGFVRADFYAHGPATTGQTWFSGDAAVPINDADSATGFRGRAAVILDARTNTAYGTLRSYGVFYNHVTTQGTAIPAAEAAGMDAAFIQFAGFTFGAAPSLWKFAGAYGLNAVVGSGDLTYQMQIAYTAQLGNGVTASLSIEDASKRRGKLATTGTVSLTTALSPAAAVGALNAGYIGQYYPDVVANVRVDQAWGSAIVMGALHHVEAAAINATNPGGSEKWGYAVGAGLEVKLDSIAPKDRAQILFTYTKGATGYLAAGPSNNSGVWAITSNNGLTGPEATWADAELNPATNSLSLAKAYGGVAQFQHYWTPMLRTNISGGYVKYNTANNVFGGGNAITLPDWTMWQVSSATIWSPVANLDLGVEVVYVDLQTKNGNYGATSTRGASSGDGWAGTFRAQRNF